MQELISYSFRGNPRVQSLVGDIIKSSIDEAINRCRSCTDNDKRLKTFAKVWIIRMTHILEGATDVFPSEVSYKKFALHANHHQGMVAKIKAEDVPGWIKEMSSDNHPKKFFKNPLRMLGSCPKTKKILCQHSDYDWTAILVAHIMIFGTNPPYSEANRQEETFKSIVSATATLLSLFARLLLPSFNHVMRPTGIRRGKKIIYRINHDKQQLELTPVGRKYSATCIRLMSRFIKLTTVEIFINASQRDPILNNLAESLLRNEQFTKTLFSFFIENIMPLKSDVSEYMREIIRAKALVFFLRLYTTQTPSPLPRLRVTLFTNIMRALGIQSSRDEAGRFRLTIGEDGPSTTNSSADTANMVSHFLCIPAVIDRSRPADNGSQCS